MNRVRAGLVIGAIVIGSALAGAGVERALVPRHRPRGGPMGPTAEQQAKRRQDMLERMSKELDLSTAQRAGIDSVLQRTDSALMRVRLETQPRVQRILETSRGEIRARLDTEQRTKFEKLGPKRR
jgi:Spy/CpxP family protein refolding chaperone